MSISLGQAFHDLTKTPQKGMTILWMSVCGLIPIAGPMVLTGYLYRRFAKVRLGQESEDFNVDHFMDYLWAGLPPFLAGLVASLLLIPALIIAYVLMFGGIMIGTQSGNGAIVAIGVVVGMLLMILLFAFIYLFIIPVQLRAGLEQQFGAGFNMAFVKSFVAKEGPSLFKWYVLLSLMAFPAMIIGYCALLVGLYVVIAVMSFVTWHIVFQHYDNYIAKGGEPVPFSDQLIYGKSVVEGTRPPPAAPPPA